MARAALHGLRAVRLRERRDRSAAHSLRRCWNSILMPSGQSAHCERWTRHERPGTACVVMGGSGRSVWRLGLHDPRVQPGVQVRASIEHTVAEADIPGPRAVTAPLRQRPVGRDRAQGGVVRTVITLGVEPVKQHAQSLTDREGFVVLGIGWKWAARFVGVRRVAQPFGFRPHRSERAGFVRDAGKGNRCRSSACAWSSKRGASAMTPLSFATAFPFHRDRRPGAVRRRIRLTPLQTAEIS